MTFREKLKMEHPKSVHPKYCGGCESCPFIYGYEDYYQCGGSGDNIKCTKCWDREIPGTNHKEEVTKTILEGRFNDLDFGDLQDVMKDPAKYNLTFGHVIQLCRVLQDIAKANNEAITPALTDYQKKVNAELRKKNRELESRLESIEKKLERMSEALEEDE